MTIIYNNNNEISIHLEGDAFRLNNNIPKKGMAYIDGQEVDAAYAEMIMGGQPDYLIHLTSADDVEKYGEFGEYTDFDVVKRDRVLYIPDVDWIDCIIYQVLRERRGWVNARFTFTSVWGGIPELVALKKEA